MTAQIIPFPTPQEPGSETFDLLRQRLLDHIEVASLDELKGMRAAAFPRHRSIFAIIGLSEMDIPERHQRVMLQGSLDSDLSHASAQEIADAMSYCMARNQGKPIEDDPDKPGDPPAA